jgi:hypothetical protein
LSGFIGVLGFYFFFVTIFGRALGTRTVKNMETVYDFSFLQVQDVEVELSDPNWTIFRAVQQLVQLADLGSRQEKLRRIWEPTYTLVDHIVV